MIRVGFRYVDSRVWTGGYNYLLNLCRAIKKYKSDEIQPIVFCGVDASEEDVAPFQHLLGSDFVRELAMDHVAIRRRTPKTLISGRDQPSCDVFTRHRIDVVFENNEFFGRAFPFPTISWIADFQHLHLKNVFTPWQRLRREIGFRSQIYSQRTIMVSSHDAKKDCQQFYGTSEDRISVVQFAVPYNGSPTSVEIGNTVKTYGLPTNFFLLPNQFWPHKNHRIVLDALEYLRSEGHEFTVVATGSFAIPRCKRVYDELAFRVEATGMKNHFRLLGNIPYPDLVSLMHSCRALINPSLFEGWSTTIEEGKAYGLTMVLSDLAVNREQVVERSVFFDPNDHFDLARQLLTTMCTERPSTPDASELSRRSEARILKFVDNFNATIGDVTKRA